MILEPMSLHVISSFTLQRKTGRRILIKGTSGHILRNARAALSKQQSETFLRMRNVAFLRRAGVSSFGYAPPWRCPVCQAEAGGMRLTNGRKRNQFARRGYDHSLQGWPIGKVAFVYAYARRSLPSAELAHVVLFIVVARAARTMMGSGGLGQRILLDDTGQKILAKCRWVNALAKQAHTFSSVGRVFLPLLVECNALLACGGGGGSTNTTRIANV